SCRRCKLGTTAGVPMRLSMRLLRSGLPVAVLAPSLVVGAAMAQPAPAKPADAGAAPPGAVAAPQPGTPDPVVGSVEGHLIYLSDLGEASKTLPENLRTLPFDTLYPVLLDRM